MHLSAHRREFLRTAPALGCYLLSLAGCSKETAAPRPSEPGANSWELRIGALENSIVKLMGQHNVPGLSMAIVRDAKLVWNRGFGFRDRASNAPVDSSTMFEAASMSKPVFAYAVMKLCERGVLDLDTPLTEYTSERFLEGDARLDLITARHVLSHTSGFQNVRSAANPLKIDSTPGQKWQYSGEGYAYLQSVVARLVGHVDTTQCGTYEADLKVCATDMDAYMRTNLLAPFGMSLSGYLWKEELAQRMARPHDEQGTPLEIRKYAPADAARYGAMGGLLTTATDYAKFLIEVIAPKPADAFRLSQISIEEMLKPQVKVEETNEYSISWALGWRIAHTAQGDLVSHGGDQTGFHSTSEVSVARKSGYVILTNGDNGWKLIQELAPDVSRWVHTHADG